MIEEIKLFILVLSAIFCGSYVLRIVISIFQPDPIPIKLNVSERILIYLASTYILTSIILAIS